MVRNNLTHALKLGVLALLPWALNAAPPAKAPTFKFAELYYAAKEDKLFTEGTFKSLEEKAPKKFTKAWFIASDALINRYAFAMDSLNMKALPNAAKIAAIRAQMTKFKTDATAIMEVMEAAKVDDVISYQLVNGKPVIKALCKQVIKDFVAGIDDIDFPLLTEIDGVLKAQPKKASPESLQSLVTNLTAIMDRTVPKIESDIWERSHQDREVLWKKLQGTLLELHQYELKDLNN